jgi:hypothetical protein
MRGTICIADAINWDSSLNRGLVSWLMALPDQQRGNVFRDLTMRNHGTLTGGPTWQGAIGRPGGFGSLSLDGSDDYADTSLPYTVFGSAFSIGCWLYRDGNPIAADTNDTLFSVGGNVYIPRLGRWQNDYGGFQFTAGEIPSDGVWTHVFVTSTGASAGETKIYNNGVSTGNDAAGGSLNNGNLRIGGQHTGTQRRYFGKLDDVRAYSRALSAAEVFAIYQDSRQGYPHTLNWRRSPLVFDMGGGGGGGYSAWWRDHGSRMIGGGIT